MRHISFRQVYSTSPNRCDLCRVIIRAGELYSIASIDNNDVLVACPSHVPLNATGFTSTTDPFEITHATPVLPVRSELIPTLLRDPDRLFAITAEEFESLVFDRLLAMGFQGIRIGPTNRKDGGIDIVIWTIRLIPMLGVVQVKHHRSPSTHVGSKVVREFAGAMAGRRFNVGILITNTSFTQDATYAAVHGSCPILLRGIEFVRRWIADDFSVERTDFVVRRMELCNGIDVVLPHFE